MPARYSVQDSSVIESLSLLMNDPAEAAPGQVIPEHAMPSPSILLSP